MVPEPPPDNDSGEVTYEILYKALINTLGKKGMGEKDVQGLTQYIINFFGFEDRVLDNVLTPNDRDVFYMLTDEGILGTESEEVTVARGKMWRIHYWVLRKENIFRLAREEISEGEDTERTIYDRLDEEVWSQRPPDE